MSPRLIGVLALACLGPVFATPAAPPRALPDGARPDDIRLQPPKDLDGYFPFRVPESRAAWEARAGQLRRQLLVTQGLWPMPARGELKPVIHGRRDQGDYTVEKVYFESAPGFFVTGNLYRPKGREGRLPAVLCPHGHWTHGRFMDEGEATAKSEVARGAERFVNGGRSPLQARCVTLARMGCVVFHYDMLGYADSRQLSMALVHGFAKQRPEMNHAERWGLFSPQAESRFQSVMGLQTWNSIRALDFLETLPDVDMTRVAVTGASGGGTQTFLLGAIDPRPAVAYPAVMVSTAMQGGCTCENASGLRVGTGNVEIAALFAPKPLGLTSANDWTLEMPTKGFPELQRLYALLGAKDNVALTHLPHFGHNYNHVSRSAMYQWMNRHLRLDLPAPVLEEDFPRLSGDELSVWDAEHPEPKGGDDFERELLQWWEREVAGGLREAWQDPVRRREVVQPAIETVVGRTLAEVGDVQLQVRVSADRGGYQEMAGVLSNPHGEAVPVVILTPKKEGGGTVVLLTRTGKAGLYGANGEPTDAVRGLLDAGSTVLGADLLYQGEFLGGGEAMDRTPAVRNPRESAAYTFGYNPTVFQRRVHDVLTVVRYAQRKGGVAVGLVAGAGAGHWAACARAVAGDAVDEGRSRIEVGAFRFAGVTDFRDPDFVPGGARYLDPFVLAR